MKTPAVGRWGGGFVAPEEKIFERFFTHAPVLKSSSIRLGDFGQEALSVAARSALASLLAVTKPARDCCCSPMLQEKKMSRK